MNIARARRKQNTRLGCFIHFVHAVYLPCGVLERHDSAGIAAYEDYLDQQLPPEPGETEWRERKFPNLARVELAKIYLGLGEYDTAAAYAEQALLEEKYPEIAAMAEDCLRRIFEAQSEE